MYVRENILDFANHPQVFPKDLIETFVLFQPSGSTLSLILKTSPLCACFIEMKESCEASREGVNVLIKSFSLITVCFCTCRLYEGEATQIGNAV